MVNHGNDLNMSASFTTGLIRPQPLNNSSCSIYKSSSAETLSGGKAVHVSKEYGYKDCDATQAPVSSRWNPTPEQVEVLKEMFRLGTSSPTAEHIQQITTLLRRFGRVEGKNVFYWFQNHKARERQRRRREKLEISSQEQRCHITESRERKKSGITRGACCEVEEKSNWGPISISKFNLLEEPVSVHRTQTSCCSNGWTQTERGLHHIRRSLSSSSTQLDAPNTRDQQHRQYEMLELFPLGNGSNNVISEEVSITTTTMSTSLSSSQIVEFLPPKI